ncbi:hypothetical protein FRB95_004102 [Tulasnella sp. JGI-2019a]|nr:hypothetical protein FRB95_004102 [Tulasnella sp. JGI-2019a]
MGGAPKNRVVVIGGGPAGLASLRVFAESKESWELTLFEARQDIGGVWNRSDDKPSEDGGRPPSAIYNSLTTNIPHPIMSFHDFPFRRGSYLYPPASDVQQYILDYAEHFKLRKYIQFGRRVERAEWDGLQWKIRISASDRSVPGVEMTCDFLIVANGHYNRPYIPDIPGLKEWMASGPGVSHSAWYREPSLYSGKKVLVIGGGPSGRDISAEVATVAAVTYHAVRGFTRDDSTNPKRRDGPVHFKSDGTIVYSDGSEDIGIDQVILGTGYEFSYPMLPQVIEEAPLVGVLFPGHTYNSRWNLYPLARHVFPIQNDYPPTSIAFIGLPSRVAPFPLMEAQAAAALRVFTHPETFDINAEKEHIAERRALLEERTSGNEHGIAKLWHRLPNYDQFDYRRDLFQFAGVTRWDVKQWHIDTYMGKDVLRNEWKDLISLGLADSWVRDIDSENGWQDLVRKLMKRAEDREKSEKATHEV